MLQDGSTLVSTEIHGVDPSQLLVNRVDPNGEIGDTLVAASQPSRGDLANWPLFGSSVTASSLEGAFVAWEQKVPNGLSSDLFVQLYVRRYRSQSGLEEPVLVRANDTGSVYGYRLAAMPSGGALLVWIESFPYDPAISPRGPRAVFAATFSETLGWSSAQQISELVSDPFLDPFLGPTALTLGVSPNGHAVVMWKQWASPSGEQVLAANRDADGSWTPPVTVFRAQDDQLRPAIYSFDVAVDDLGNALAVWELVSGDGTVHRADFNRFDVSNGWLGASTLSSPGEQPRVIVNAAGTGIVSWCYPGAVVAAPFDVSGWQDTKLLTPVETGYADAADPRPLIDEIGRIVVIWNQAQFLDAAPHYVVRGARFQPGQGWSSNATLSPTSELALVSSLTNSVDGQAAVLWNQGDITGGRASYWVLSFSLAP